LFTIAAVLASAFSGPSPVRLATIFYCLRFETSLLSPPTTRSVTVEVFDPASTRDASCESITFPFIIRCGPATKHTPGRFVCCNSHIRFQGMRVYQTAIQQRSITRCMGNHVFIPKQRLSFLSVYNLLPGNDSFTDIVLAGTCFLGRCSATNVWLWLHCSGFRLSSLKFIFVL
jgi:hypothetical protein